jgi:Protein of unknown function (DUF1553)/Protein of unknown function (DUF1549)
MHHPESMVSPMKRFDLAFSIRSVLIVPLCLFCAELFAAEKPVTAEDRRHWAFQAPVRPTVPQVKRKGWVKNPIDAFVLAALEENELRPSAEADRTTLLRRVTFDLTGLPPTPEEVKAFVADKSTEAYANMVDRLLASPHYGERWAQHWLDLARYADSDGFEFDQARPDAWRYRDWVVEALNQDMPYDQFVRWQLAGDELAPNDVDAFIATGLNRCYPDMVDLNDQKLRRQNALNDITETTGLVFLGLTIGCARCHDHKFDPIRIHDFYRLQAFFTPARFRDDFPIGEPEEREAYETRYRRWEEAVTAFQEAVIHVEQPVRSALTPDLLPTVNDETAAAFTRSESERTPSDVHLIYESQAKDRRIGPGVWTLVLDPTSASLREFWMARLAALKKAVPPSLPHARGLDEVSPEAPPTYVLNRGEPTAKGDLVAPAFPLVLCPDGSAAVPAASPKAHSTGRRKALADWLTTPGHPLTARVIVNRLWQHHFGHGLVATPSDFGTMGSEPTHPELLDWLATELIARGWSLKAMHRLILTGAAYRQSSRTYPAGLAADPENSLLWRYNRQRLDGESIRDSLLAVSGRLNPEMGGPCIFPELPAELAKLSNKGVAWPVSDHARDRNRRSLYVFIRRNLRYPFFEAFDRPDTNASCPRRPVTTIAPQALTLLNSHLASDAAVALAARLKREAGPDREAQVERAYLLVFARSPDAEERRIAREFLGSGEALGSYCRALLNANEFIYID